jgi:hypothetical protein
MSFLAPRAVTDVLRQVKRHDAEDVHKRPMEDKSVDGGMPKRAPLAVIGGANHANIISSSTMALVRVGVWNAFS